MSRDGVPQRRGEQLRRHILLEAKQVFLEAGYERASMDTVATRAGTSKRSLYAHFESKDKLFLAVLELIRELYLGSLKTPDAYASDPVEAVTLYCGRFQQLMTWEPQVRTCRLAITEAERLPGSSTTYFEAMFATTCHRLAAYLTSQYHLEPADGAALSEDLLARTVLQRLFRTLLNVDQPHVDPPNETPLTDAVDLAPIRRLVTAALPA